MKSTTLGLPFEYQQFPEYFDAWSVNNTTADKNAVIERLLKNHKIQTVLDMTCGTGSQVFYLAKRGYQISGSDFSPQLLIQARKKARAEKVSVKFIDGDMRTLNVGHFDAVITIANAIGHLTQAGFEKSLKNIRRNLCPHGIYIFDIFNLEAMSDKTVAGLACYTHKKYKDSQLHNVQFSTIDRKHGLLTSYDHISLQKRCEKPKLLQKKFSLQIYTVTELKKILAKNGFKMIEHYDIDGHEFIKNKSLSLLVIAKRVD